MKSSPRALLLILLLSSCILLILPGCMLRSPRSPQWSGPPQSPGSDEAALALIEHGGLAAPLENPVADAPSLMIIARWLNYYGSNILPRDGSMYEVRWCDVSSATEWVLQTERRRPATEWPPGFVGQLENRLNVFVYDAEVPTIRARVAMVDSTGRQGRWSPWGTTATTLGINCEGLYGP